MSRLSTDGWTDGRRNVKMNSETEFAIEHFSERVTQKGTFQKRRSKKRSAHLFHFISRVKGLAKGLFEKTVESFSSPRPDFIMSRGENVKRKFEI